MRNLPVNRQIQGRQNTSLKDKDKLKEILLIHSKRNHKGLGIVLMSSLDFSRSRMRKKKILYSKAKNKGAKARGLADIIVAT